MVNGYVFKELDKEKILKIYQLAASTRSWKDALDKIIAYTRQYFIFDNVVIYLGEITTRRVDVLYARATGRGKSREADVAWGETIANRVISEKKNIIEEPGENDPEDRLSSPYMLGVPLFISQELTGALIFIRFGGPAFERGSTEFAEFLGMQFASVIRQKSLADYEKELANLRTSSTIQGDFISTISHELRNPLGFIRGYTTTLLREDASWDKNTQRDFLEIIDRETSHLAELIDDLLDSSRLQSGNLSFDFQLLHLDALIRDEVKRALHANPKQMIKLDLNDTLPLVTGDPRRLAQVIDNLIENSQKYAPDAEICIRAFPSESEMVIEYTDSGPGIDEKYLPMMFSRFFRVPGLARTVYGTGLGLSICKQIISSHNGEITVDSSQGEGVKFTIKLPLNQNV
jgi:signal transduction histidine kinase